MREVYVEVFALYLLLLLVCLWMSRIANRQWLKRNPDKLNFTWGYFVVFSSTAMCIFSLIAIFDHVVRNLVELMAFLVLNLLVLFMGLLGALRVKRACWALTLLSLNLPIWIGSFFYLRRRAAELDHEALQGQSGFSSLPKSLRIKIFWFAIWAIFLPVIFHFFDDNFAYESTRIFFAMLLPFPLFQFVLFVYRRYVI